MAHASQAGTDLTGQDADGFLVLQRIGQGAASVVYQAMERTRDNRLVALKVLDATEQRLIQRRVGARANPFEREARFSRVVKDPAIVRIFRTGRLPDGRFYVAMELVAGATIEEHLAQGGRFSWAEAVDIIHQAARAVGTLHAIDIIHRDIKPGNLMVYPAKDGRTRVKLIDFGLARLSHERDDVGAGVEPGSVGTPLYMAPEQARGGGTSPRTDVYALGAILYEMLARVPALDLRRPTAAACLEYLRGDHPVPARTLAEAGAGDVPPEVARVVDRCLSRDPARRPADGAAMAALLGEFVARAPSTHRGPAGKGGGGGWRAALRGLWGARPKGGRFTRSK